jgi:hypothetical protein
VKLFIATPMFGAQCAGIYADSMCRLYDHAARSDIRLQHRFYYNASLITTARTRLANEFMDGDADYLLFVDADIGFDPAHVFTLAWWQRKNGAAIIGAPYLKKHIRWDKVSAACKKGVGSDHLTHYTGDYAVRLLHGADLDMSVKYPVDAEYIGAGFMLIPRSTFGAFRTSYPSYVYGGGAKALYFQAEIQDDAYVSEDVFFCNMVRKAGGKVMCCPWMKISHFGNHTFGGPPTEFVS